MLSYKIDKNVFHRNKIWVRCTKRSRRDYKITIAIVDSRSMDYSEKWENKFYFHWALEVIHRPFLFYFIKTDAIFGIFEYTFIVSDLFYQCEKETNESFQCVDWLIMMRFKSWSCSGWAGGEFTFHITLCFYHWFAYQIPVFPRYWVVCGWSRISKIRYLQMRPNCCMSNSQNKIENLPPSTMKMTTRQVSIFLGKSVSGIDDVTIFRLIVFGCIASIFQWNFIQL